MGRGYESAGWSLPPVQGGGNVVSVRTRCRLRPARGVWAGTGLSDTAEAARSCRRLGRGKVQAGKGGRVQPGLGKVRVGEGGRVQPDPGKVRTREGGRVQPGPPPPQGPRSPRPGRPGAVRCCLPSGASRTTAGADLPRGPQLCWETRGSTR